ncbi:MAG: hypothetical protein CSA45_03030 [Gammaproteobacteria bacterium]|nr:MAG: hypothetical protein CSA45_03030 [Gammaproteobacteria bacterium]
MLVNSYIKTNLGGAVAITLCCSILSEANSQVVNESVEIGIHASNTPVIELVSLPSPDESGNLYDIPVDLLPGEASKAIATTLSDQVDFVNWGGRFVRLHSPQKVAQLYRDLNYRSLWIANGTLTPLAQALIKETQKAKYHALKNSTYHTDITTSLMAGQTVPEPNKLDMILSDAFVSYKKHLSNGIVNPKKQFSTWNLSPPAIDYAGLYLRANTSGSLDNIFVVDDADYNALQQRYEATIKDKESSTGTSETIIIPAKSLKPGDKGESVRLLRQRLGLLADTDSYDDELTQAVTDFQTDKGLAADGIAGPKTIATLNGKKPAISLNKLAINMERYRWGYIPKDTYHVWVNIPSYQMAVKDGNTKIFQSKVIVGKKKRPTPIFSDELESVVLAPYWNVPTTIFKKDKLPRLKKNPNAFGSTMEVVNTATGKTVNASSVDWQTGGNGYRLRQRPGSRNALGYMKFLFPNRHAIYLHDTPSRHLFKRKKRAYSSGCVRVQRAEDLAVFLLESHGYDRKRIKKESRRGREKWVRLDESQRYPVFLNYYTVWVDDKGNIRNSSDIYGYDRLMSELYERKLEQL